MKFRSGKYAGKDISHWFDPKTQDPKTCIDHKTGVKVYFTPEGRFLDVPDLLYEWGTGRKHIHFKPWWK